LRVYRDIFIDVLKSGLKWTGETDDLLRHFISQFGKSWSDIASRIPNRTATQVAAHWEKCTNPKLTNTSRPRRKPGQHLRLGERTRAAEDHVRASALDAQAMPRALVQQPRPSARRRRTCGEGGLVFEADLQQPRSGPSPRRQSLGERATRRRAAGPPRPRSACASQGEEIPKRNAGDAKERAQPLLTASPKVWTIGDADEAAEMRRIRNRQSSFLLFEETYLRTIFLIVQNLTMPSITRFRNL
jgi:hypothetical protein